jgi:hypothetical protein
MSSQDPQPIESTLTDDSTPAFETPALDALIEEGLLDNVRPDPATIDITRERAEEIAAAFRANTMSVAGHREHAQLLAAYIARNHLRAVDVDDAGLPYLPESTARRSFLGRLLRRQV